MRIASIVVTILLVGCNHHTDIAVQAANKAEETRDTIIKDLETIAIQQLVDSSAAAAEQLVMDAEQLGRLNEQLNQADAASKPAIQTQINALRSKIATGTSDTDGIVVNLVSSMDSITWLSRTQNERARNVNGVAKRFIYQQQSWFEVLSKEWTEAKQRVEINKAKAVLKAAEQ